MSTRPTSESLGLASLLVLLVGGLLLACGAAPPQTMMADSSPAWACPSPTPKPYSEAGPVKEWTEGDALPTRAPSGPVRHEQIPVYYEEWEQEYGAEASGPPFPSPTPYVVEGNIFSLGQRVRVAPLFVTVNARSGQLAANGQQLYFIDLTWLNTTINPVPISYGSQVRLRNVRLADGTEITGDEWRVSTSAMELSGLDPLPNTIPLGESRAMVPIIAPAGEASVVEVTVRRDTAYVPAYASTGTPLPTATPTVVATPTPNTDLRATTADVVVVAFTAERPSGPECGSPGAVTNWDRGDDLPNGVPDVPVQAPPGSGRLVELALAQIGKPYVWGATGPNSFDCSGLVVWAYGQIGQRIPGRTAEEQFRRMRPVDATNALPGDPMYFNSSGNPNARITHTAIYVGDINGDRVGDVVHAASPKYGVLLVKNGVQNPYYFGGSCELCFTGYRTMR